MGQRRSVFGPDRAACDICQKFLQEFPDYPDRLMVYKKLLPLAPEEYSVRVKDYFSRIPPARQGVFKGFLFDQFDRQGSVATPAAPAAATFSFEASDVTGMHRVVASDVQRNLPAGAVARALAVRMSLPENVPWALRDETTSAFLDDDKPIGEQIELGAKVTVTPKTHLG